MSQCRVSATHSVRVSTHKPFEIKRTGGKEPACSHSVKRPFILTFALLSCLTLLGGATLERLSLDEMIAKSTRIIRGKVTGSWAAFSGPVIYTHYAVLVSERLKGGSQATIEIVVPGGVANNLRQSFAGAPELNTGDEYVMLLWTGKDGATQIIGLTQGLFSVAKDAASDPLATRTASREQMVERSTGQPVKDQTLVMRLSELRTRIAGNPGAVKVQ